MQVLKYILVGIGVIAIIASIFFMVVGFKVVSAVVGWIVGAIAVIALIGFIVYFFRKAST